MLSARECAHAPSFVPACRIHLVDSHNECFAAQSARERRVLASLPAALKARLERARRRVQQQQRRVRLRRARQSSGHKVCMAWRIQQRHRPRAAVGQWHSQLHRAHVQCDAARAFLRTCIQRPRPAEAALARCCGVAQQLGNGCV